MRLTIVGSFWPGALEESYAQAFESLGWLVERFDWDGRARRLSPKSAVLEKLSRLNIADKVGKELNAQLQRTPPDVVFVLKGRTISAETLAGVKRLLGDRRLINFNPDSPWEKANTSSRLIESIPCYDHHFTWNRGLIARFEEVGARSVHYLPFAYDPLLHAPTGKPVSQEFDAVFVGTFDANRDKLLGNLTGCKIGIWGNGWEKATHVPRDWVQSEAIYGESSVRVLDRSFCAINILRPQNTGSHNMRTFEIPATRHAMLTTRSAEQSEFFQEGEEMVSYETPEELFATIRALNNDPDYARSIALKGYERVKDETYTKRARTILQTLGLSTD